tara:strand:+ start:2215 stop:2406 length:192 start_codon:yes stop_codon:yes gene_type:complete
MKKEEEEENEVFMKRMFEICKVMPENEEKYKLAEKYSKIWVSMKYLKCKYPQEIEINVKKLFE